MLSLGLFPGEYLDTGTDERTHFRFEAAWDSSLHNSLLLNRVTPSGETVYMTISAYLEVRIFVQWKIVRLNLQNGKGLLHNYMLRLKSSVSYISNLA